MIGYLKGTASFSGSELIIIVNGVGYQVHVGTPTLSAISALEEIELYIHTHVREDALELYGFKSSEEKRLFLLLLNVSGVGPRTALAITERDPESIISAVQQANSSFFSSIPRVGKKVAQKIIIDLKSKLGSLKDLDLSPLSTKESEILSAVIALGFDEEAARSLIRDSDFSDVTLEEAVKRIIQKFGKV